MKHRGLFIVAISLISVSALGLLGTLVLTQDGPGSGRAGGVDAMFIEQMIPHHQDAIDMSELALSRAEHPEIRQLAADIKRTQTAENEQMRGWYRDWFGSDVREADGMGMMGPMMDPGTDLERLSDAEDFEKEFIEQMVPHHQMALMMAQMAGRSTRRAEMRDLTDSILETQSREIRDMERWYREWYEL